MKLFKKSTLSLALTAAMIGGVAATQTASAYPQAATAGPVVSNSGLGQALIYPYYSVRGGTQTTINVFNTSTTHAVAVKVRFREHQNSRDVLDFNLVLSPNDKWFANLNASAAGGVVLSTTDKSCTVPENINGQEFLNDAYTFSAFQDSGSQDLARLQEGYAEIIPMAWSSVTTDPTFAGALHSQATGNPGSCAAVTTAFTPTTSWDTVLAPVVVGDGAPAISADADWVAIPAGENPLFGETFIKNNGVGGGSNAVAIADWMAGVKLTTAQAFPYFLEPTLGTSAGVWDTTNLPATDDALTSSTVINEWASNPLNNAEVDWAVTMPTKSFHVDVAAANIQAGSSNFRAVGAGGGTATPLAPFTNAFALGRSDVAYGAQGYNNEEGEAATGPGPGVSIPPGTFNNPDVASLRFEANVISFGAGTILNSASPADASGLVASLPTGSSNGYARLTFNNGAAGTPAALPLPVVGFALKTRETTTSGDNFGQMLDHKTQ